MVQSIFSLRRCPEIPTDAVARLQATAFAFLAYDKFTGGQAAEWWHSLISLAYPVLAKMDLVGQITAIAARAWGNRDSSSSALFGFVEFCSGKGELTKAFIRRQQKVACFEILYSQQHDMLSKTGLRLFLEAVGLTRPNGKNWYGTKCSSFVSLCSSVAQRCPQNEFRGDETKDFVHEGNCQVEVMSLSMFIGLLLDVHPLLEQPLNSVMVKLGSLARIFTFFNFVKVVTWLGAYGGPSPKPLQIWSQDVVDMTPLCRPKPEGLSCDLVEIADDGSYTGVKSKLVESEFYTKDFGDMVANCLI